MATVSLVSQSPQPTGTQQPVPFRAGVNFVRVDVYPTAKDGRHAGDLTAADFEVFEDRVPQRIATFEHIVLNGTAPAAVAERVDPGPMREVREAAAQPRSRVFVIFLDAAHVTDPAAYQGGHGHLVTAPNQPVQERLGPPPSISSALTEFIGRMAPDDLVALMTPAMEVGSLTFVRRPASIEEYLRTEWARRFSGDPADAEEAAIDAECGWPQELKVKRREERSIAAARDLVGYLAGLREERKTVLLVSEGWMLYGRNNQTARPPQPDQVSPPPGIFVGADGKLHAGSEDRSYGNRLARCHAEAGRLSQVDDARSFRDLLEEANRANVSFYPVDPRGLPPFDAMVQGAPGVQPVPRGKDQSLDNARETTGLSDRALPGLASQASLTVRLDTLRTLANGTDGLMGATNDLMAVVQRVADDLSAYYLLGYSSTNAKADGTFRRITVRVRREGVTVRARRGYRAPTREELDATRASAGAAPGSAAEAVRDALAALAPREDLPFAAEAGQGCATEGGGVKATVWATGAMTAAARRNPAWQAGVAVDVTLTDGDGRARGSQHVDLSPSKGTFEITLASDVDGGEHTVRVVGRPMSAESLPVNQTVHVNVNSPGDDGASCVGTGRLLRRSPFSGPSFVPALAAPFRREERVRLEVPVAGQAQAMSAELLDRTGKPIPVPLTLAERLEGTARWITADASLAPLAPGDYLIRLQLQAGATGQTLLRAFRVVR